MVRPITGMGASSCLPSGGGYQGVPTASLRSLPKGLRQGRRPAGAGSTDPKAEFPADGLEGPGSRPGHGPGEASRQEGQEAVGHRDRLGRGAAATGTYYTEEDEATTVIDVVRIGSIHSPCSVRFETQDGTAKAKLHYMPVKGTLEFKPHDVQDDRGDNLDTPSWNATLEFGCC